MRRHDRFISASEIGTWCYCKRAWHLQQLGHPSTLKEEQWKGTRYHQAHFQNLRRARRQRALSRVVMLICLALFIWFGIAGSWSPRW
jgi:hypothetical protein